MKTHNKIQFSAEPRMLAHLKRVRKNSNVALPFPNKVRDNIFTVQRTDAKEIGFLTYKISNGDSPILYPKKFHQGNYTSYISHDIAIRSPSTSNYF